jgi:hypothetical protein
MSPALYASIAASTAPTACSASTTVVVAGRVVGAAAVVVRGVVVGGVVAVFCDEAHAATTISIKQAGMRILNRRVRDQATVVSALFMVDLLWASSSADL